MDSDSQSGVAVLRQRFEFAASHRLHIPGLEDAANREMFGKCNNENGHGHNYVIEPAVSITVSDGPPPLTVDALDNESAAATNCSLTPAFSMRLMPADKTFLASAFFDSNAGGTTTSAPSDAAARASCSPRKYELQSA